MNGKSARALRKLYQDKQFYKQSKKRYYECTQKQRAKIRGFDKVIRKDTTDGN